MAMDGVGLVVVADEFNAIESIVRVFFAADKELVVLIFW